MCFSAFRLGRQNKIEKLQFFAFWLPSYFYSIVAYWAVFVKTRATLPLDLEGKPHIWKLPSDCLFVFTVLLSSVLSCWKRGQTSFVNKYHHLQKLSQKSFPEIPSTSFAKNWQINVFIKENTVIKGKGLFCAMLHTFLQKVSLWWNIM